MRGTRAKARKHWRTRHQARLKHRTVQTAPSTETQQNRGPLQIPAQSPKDPGWIDESGLYAAPDQIDQPYTVTVTATRHADVANTATATIQLQPSVRVWMEPASVHLYQADTQQFVATVYGADNTAVTWSVEPPTEMVSASGLYTAPAHVEESRYVNVVATSQADPTKSAYAEVLVLAPPVQVSVNPATATLYKSQTQRFTATVLNTQNTAVTWSLSPKVGGIDASGLYAAPDAISSSQTVTVTATSEADNSAKASATITLMPRQSSSITSPPGLTAAGVSRSRIDLSWNPSSKPGGGIAGYNVFRGGTLAGSTEATSYSDLGLVRSTAYGYTVTAYDAQGDNSAPSSASATTLANPPPAGLVASYDFEEGAGTVLHDSSGYGNNGAITGAEWVTLGQKGLQLSADSSVIVPGSPSLDLTGALTLEAWVNPSTLGGWTPVIVKEQEDGLCYSLFANNTWPDSRVFIDQEQQHVSGNQRIPLNAWTHLAATYDGAALQLYLNGALVGGKANWVG